MFETNLSGHNKIWGHFPRMLPHGYGSVLLATSILRKNAKKTTTFWKPKDY